MTNKSGRQAQYFFRGKLIAPPTNQGWEQVGPLSRDIPRQLIRPRVEEPDCRDTSTISGRYFRGFPSVGQERSSSGGYRVCCSGGFTPASTPTADKQPKSLVGREESSEGRVDCFGSTSSSVSSCLRVLVLCRCSRLDVPGKSDTNPPPSRASSLNRLQQRRSLPPWHRHGFKKRNYPSAHGLHKISKNS